MSESDCDNEAANKTCPVCGQEYLHKRQESSRGNASVLRDDYSECRWNHRFKEMQTVYVHDKQRTVVNRLQRDPDYETFSDKLNRVIRGGRDEQ